MHPDATATRSHGEPGARVPPGFEVIAQRGAGLADRLAAGFADVADTAIVIASDTPQVDAPSLGLALRSLTTDSPHVIGPAADGRYRLLGLSPHVDPTAVFEGIPMSTNETYRAQLGRLDQLGIAPPVLHELRDTDTIAAVIAVSMAYPRTHLAHLAMGVPALRPVP